MYNTSLQSIPWNVYFHYPAPSSCICYSTYVVGIIQLVPTTSTHGRCRRTVLRIKYTFNSLAFRNVPQWLPIRSIAVIYQPHLVPASASTTITHNYCTVPQLMTTCPDCLPACLVTHGWRYYPTHRLNPNDISKFYDNINVLSPVWLLFSTISTSSGPTCETEAAA